MYNLLDQHCYSILIRKNTSFFNDKYYHSIETYECSKRKMINIIFDIKLYILYTCYMRACIYAWVYACMYVCMYVCMHVCICKDMVGQLNKMMMYKHEMRCMDVPVCICCVYILILPLDSLPCVPYSRHEPCTRIACLHIIVFD